MDLTRKQGEGSGGSQWLLLLELVPLFSPSPAPLLCIGVRADLLLLLYPSLVLAFKNDISFWRKRKNIEGISVRSIFVSVMLQSIILLYLFDNNTSFLILVSSSINLLIDIWKIQKAVHIKVGARRLTSSSCVRGALCEQLGSPFRPPVCASVAFSAD